MTKDNLIEIFKMVDKYNYALDNDIDLFADEIFTLHNIEMAKYKELVEAYKELLRIQNDQMNDLTRRNREDDDLILWKSLCAKEEIIRRKIAELESEVRLC